MDFQALRIGEDFQLCTNGPCGVHMPSVCNVCVPTVRRVREVGANAKMEDVRVTKKYSMRNYDEYIVKQTFHLTRNFHAPRHN